MCQLFRCDPIASIALFRCDPIALPKDCARCHTKEGEEFAHSHHSKGARILGSLDHVLAEVVEGNRGMITLAVAVNSHRHDRQNVGFKCDDRFHVACAT